MQSIKGRLVPVGGLRLGLLCVSFPPRETAPQPMASISTQPHSIFECVKEFDWPTEEQYSREGDTNTASSKPSCGNVLKNKEKMCCCFSIFERKTKIHHIHAYKGQTQ